MLRSLVKGCRIEYGGRNSSLVSMLPLWVCVVVTCVGMLGHLCSGSWVLCAWLVVGTLAMVLGFVCALWSESRYQSVSSTRAGTACCMAWLICFEVSFFGGAIWLWALGRVHGSVEAGLRLGELYQGSVESRIGLDCLATCCALVSGFNVSLMTEVCCPVLVNLLILLWVSLCLQWVHRCVQWLGA